MLDPIVLHQKHPYKRATGAQIEKKDLNVDVRYRFGFISSTIVPSMNGSVLPYAKVAFLGCIMEYKRTNLGNLINKRVSIKKQNIFPFHIIYTEVCRRAKVPTDARKDMEVAPSAFAHI